MSTTSFNHTPNVNASAAAYNTFFGLIRSTLLAFGWTQTADTGQVDFATNVTNPTIGTHYQLFEPGDALQATYPYILKIGYGNVSGFATMTLQLGQQTDGAGNFIGNFTTPISITNSASAGSTTTFITYASGDTDRFWFAICGSTTLSAVGTHMFFIGFERSKDASGANTGEFATLFCSGGNTVASRQCSLHNQYGPTNNEQHWVAPFHYANPNAGFGVGGGTFPVFPFLGKLENASKDFGLCKSADFAHLAIIACESYSVSRNYRVFDGGSSANNNSTIAVVPVSAAANRAAILARWE